MGRSVPETHVAGTLTLNLLVSAVKLFNSKNLFLSGLNRKWLEFLLKIKRLEENICFRQRMKSKTLTSSESVGEKKKALQTVRVFRLKTYTCVVWDIKS